MRRLSSRDVGILGSGRQDSSAIRIVPKIFTHPNEMPPGKEFRRFSEQSTPIRTGAYPCNRYFTNAALTQKSHGPFRTDRRVEPETGLDHYWWDVS